MKSYGQYCPIAKSVEVLGERWSILVLRELLIGSTRFNDIARGLPGMSRTMLSKRLREFESAGLVERLDGEYHLTAAGSELRGFVFGLGQWGEQWLLAEPQPAEIDPLSLFWHAHARFDTSELPDRRVVIGFELTDRPERFWVVIDTLGCSVCSADPGFDVDVLVRAEATTLYRVWYHQQDLDEVLRIGLIELDGQPALKRRMSTLLNLRPPDVLGADVESPSPTWHGG